jgi:hypothetical protein
MYLSIRAFSFVRKAFMLSAVSLGLTFSAFAQQAATPLTPAEPGRRSCELRKALPGIAAAETKPGRTTLRPVTFAPPPGCRVYEIVDGECFQQCIEERGLPGKNFCRQACKYTVIECDTFPPVSL